MLGKEFFDPDTGNLIPGDYGMQKLFGCDQVDCWLGMRGEFKAAAVDECRGLDVAGDNPPAEAVSAGIDTENVVLV